MENNMSEENNQVNPIDSLVKSVIDGGVKIEMERLQSDLNAQEIRARGYRDELFKLRNTVHEFFNNEFDSGEEEVTIHRDEANELLGDIGANLLQQEYEGRVLISYSFTVKAESEDEAREKVESAVSGMEYNFDAGADDSYSEESIEVDI
jgi:hypothetical protein